MKRMLGIVLALVLVLSAAVAGAAGKGEPYGDSDGVIPHEKLAALYNWLSHMESSFRKQLSFDDVGAAVGKAGHDRGDASEKYHAADWCDEESRYYVVVTFYYHEETESWGVGSISTGMNSEEYSAADFSAFPHIGNRVAGSSPVESVTVTVRNAPYTVTADVPTEYWYTGSAFGQAMFYNYAMEKNAKYSESSIGIRFEASAEARESNLSGASDMQEIDGTVLAGIEMRGCTYTESGIHYTEYYGYVPGTDTLVCIQIRNLDIFPGSEAEAILNSLSFASAE